jgi:hypothetical protein
MVRRDQRRKKKNSLDLMNMILLNQLHPINSPTSHCIQLMYLFCHQEHTGDLHNSQNPYDQPRRISWRLILDWLSNSDTMDCLELHLEGHSDFHHHHPSSKDLQTTFASEKTLQQRQEREGG